MAVSRGVADDMIARTGVPADLVRVIYNPVISAEMNAAAGEAVEHPWLMPGGPEVILGVGRLTPHKDFPTLLRAFAILRRTRDCRLLILGEGEERPRLEQLLRDLHLTECVGLPGFVNNPFAYLAKASLYVLSSAWEALPTVLIEALAVGVPVVSTDCRSGPTEILAGGRYGRLVPVGDADSLARAMTDTLSEPRRELPEEALGRFRLDFAIDEYCRLIAEVSGDRPTT